MGQSTSSLSGGSFPNYEDYDIYQKNKERRIILIGKTGAGKSTLGNAILGTQAFKNECVPMQANTKYCQIGYSSTKNGKDIIVLDTPGLMDSKREPDEIITELCQCTAMTAPGPHAFCLVIRCDERFTRESVDILEEFCAFFGEEIYKHLIVVFTHKASMGKNVSTDDCLKSLPVEFQEKLTKFGGTEIAIECKAEKKVIQQQVNELLALIENIIKGNNGGYYSEEKFKAAEKAFRKRIPKIQQLVERKFEAVKHLLTDEYQVISKRIEDREDALEKKLQEGKNKIEQEKQLKEKEKANIQEEVKMLEENREKEWKEKEKAKTDYDRKMEEINKEEKQDLCRSITEDRNKARADVPQSEGWDDLAKNAVMEGAGMVFDVVKGRIGGLIENLVGLF